MEKNELFATVSALKTDCAAKQKKGLHFILASVLIWAALAVIHAQTGLPLTLRNLLTFCCSVPLMPLAYLFSRLLRIDFSNRGNPLTSLGILFSVGQMPYLLIAMWAYARAPQQMLMLYAMIFGAHLLPFGWLYDSKTYYVFSGVVPVLALFVGLNAASVHLSLTMLAVEIAFCALLALENRQLARRKDA